MKMGDTEQIEKKKKSIVRGFLGSKGTLIDLAINQLYQQFRLHVSKAPSKVVLD
jgi:hypothetical protein